MIAFWLAGLSAILNSAKDIVAKKVLGDYHLNPSSIVFQRDTLMTVMMLLLFPLVNFSSLFDLWHIYLFKGFSALIGVCIFYTLLKKYQISVVTPMMNLSPVFLVFISAILVGESVSLLQIFGIIVIVIGAYLLEFFAHEHHKRQQFSQVFKRYKFYGLIVLMLVAFSITASLDKIIVRTQNVFTDMFFTALVVVISMTIYGIVTKKYVTFWQDIIRAPKSLWVSLLDSISVIVIVTAMTIPGALVSLLIPIRRLSTLFSALFGGLLFHEKHLVKKMCCVFLMVVGTVLIVI